MTVQLKKITTLAPNQRKNGLKDSNTHMQMPKQPSTLVPTEAHNGKEDKTSGIVFFKNQVPTGSSLYQKTHNC